MGTEQALSCRILERTRAGEEQCSTPEVAETAEERALMLQQGEGGEEKPQGGLWGGGGGGDAGLPQGQGQGLGVTEHL